MPLLDWYQREEELAKAAKRPYHLLQPVTKLNYGEQDAPNLLIQGDNLDALKALLPYYAGQVKCVFIDPPYNTKSAFEHYDDNLEHATWLSTMFPRLKLLRELLSEDGSIWITLDDNEAHYFKVMADEVFGRKNFVSNVIWEKSDSPKMDAKLFSSRHDHLLVFAKNIDRFQVNKLPSEAEETSHYNRTDEQGRRYYTKPLRAMGSGEDTREARPSMYFPLEAPDGSPIFPMKPDGTEGRWRWGPGKVSSEADRLEWVRGRKGWSVYYRIYADGAGGRPPETIWPHGVVGSNRTSKAEVKKLFGEETTFTTPKPEGVIWQVLRIATSPGDLVLDSFLGSGTTAAVAHKMGRRWIGVEQGEHARTHCHPRLVKVVDGEQGGVSEAVGWQGGGGFRFAVLGPAVFDEHDQIREDIKFEHLAAHVWFSETGTARSTRAAVSPFLGEHHGVGYYLLYNGILGDKRPAAGNVLTNKVVKALPPFEGPKVIYGEVCGLSNERLAELGITFKQTPYDIKARR